MGWKVIMQAPQNHSNRRFNEADYLPSSIKQRHIEPSAKLIFTGNDANLPDGSTHERIFFAFDTKKLYIWNETTESWNSTTLT